MNDDYGTQLMNKWLNKRYEVTQTPGAAAPSTRRYYRTHAGYDYATPAGTKLNAKTSGQVVYAGYDPSGYGNRVGIYEPDTGKTTYLSHLADIAVKKGQMVNPGLYLGATGGVPGTRGAGNTTGAHLDITEYKGNKVFTNSGKATGKVTGNIYSQLLAKARSKYGNKLIAASTNPQKLASYGSKLKLKGKVVRL